MADTQSIKEHVKAIRDQVKAANDKQGEEAKAAVRRAMEHLELARKQLESRLQSDFTQDEADRKKTLEHLQTVATNGAAALKESGAQMQTKIRNMLNTTDEILTKDL